MKKSLYDPAMIMGRLLTHANAKSIPELALRWDIPQSTLYNWKKEGTFKIETILQKSGNINLHWLLTGDESSDNNDNNRYVEIGKAAEKLFELLNKKAPEGSSEA